MSKEMKDLIKPRPTMADLREKNTRLRTEHYALSNTQELLSFLYDLELVVNNESKYAIVSFNSQSEPDGSPYIVVRYSDRTNLSEVTKNKIKICGNIFNKSSLNELDEIINKHDLTSTFLLLEKSFVVKGITSDFYILLIWAEVESPLRQSEALNAIRKFLTSNFR